MPNPNAQQRNGKREAMPIEDVIDSLKVTSPSPEVRTDVRITEEEAARDAQAYAALAGLNSAKIGDAQARDGARLFDAMFAQLSSGNARLGNGNWRNRNQIYVEMGMYSPMELFYIDGKPVSEYIEEKYGDSDQLTDSDGMHTFLYENLMKAEIMAAALSGEHHLELVQAEVWEPDAAEAAAEEEETRRRYEAGALAASVSELQLDLSALGGRLARRAERSRNSDQGRQARQDEVRAHFGNRLAAEVQNIIYHKQPIRDAEKAFHTTGSRAELFDQYFTSEQRADLDANDQRMLGDMDRGTYRDQTGAEVKGYGGLTLFARMLVMAKNPDIRYADLADPTKYAAEKAAAGREVYQAFMDYAKSPEEYPDKNDAMVEVTRQVMLAMGRMDARREVLYAVGADPDLTGPEALEAMHGSQAARGDVLLRDLEDLAISLHQMVNSFVPDTFSMENGIPQDILDKSDFYRRLERKMTGQEIRDYCRNEDNLRSFNILRALNDQLSSVNQLENKDPEKSSPVRYQALARKILAEYEKGVIAGSKKTSETALLYSHEMQVNDIVNDLATRLETAEKKLAGIPENGRIGVSSVGSYLLGGGAPAPLHEILDRVDLSDPESHISEALRGTLQFFAESVSKVGAGQRKTRAQRQILVSTDPKMYFGENLGEQEPVENFRDTEISRLEKGARFFVPDRGPSLVSNVLFHMMGEMSFEDALSATSSQRRAAGEAFKQFLSENQFSDKKPDERTEQEKRHDRSAAAAYGAYFRRAEEGLRQFRLPAGNLSDPVFWADHVQQLNAFRLAAIDCSQNKQTQEKMDGFWDGYMRNDDLDIQNYETPVDLMGQFCQAAQAMLDPRLIDSTYHGDTVTVMQVAGKMFVDAYAELYMGKTPVEAAAGMGNREAAHIMNFLPICQNMVQDRFGNEEFRRQCEAYLKGEGPSPITAEAVERATGYIRDNVYSKGMRETVQESLSRGETEMGTIDSSRFADSMSGTWEPDVVTPFMGVRSLVVEKTAEPVISGAPLTLPDRLGENEKDLVRLSGLGSGRVSGTMRSAGAAYFDRMFQAIAADNRGLGNGDFKRAHEIYRELGMESPADLFYVDGKPFEDYLGKKYENPLAVETEVRKAELAAAILSGRHHIEFVRAEVDQAGNYQVGLSELRADLKALDPHVGFFQRKPSALAAGLYEKDENKETRQNEIRHQFGEKLATAVTRSLNVKKPLKEARSRFSNTNPRVSNDYFTEEQRELFKGELDSALTSEMRRDLGSLTRLAQLSLMADHPEVRYADLMDPDKYQEEKLAAGRAVVEALQDLKDETPERQATKHYKMTDLVRKSMTAIADLDIKKELLYAMGVSGNPSPENMAALMKQEAHAPAVNAVLGSLALTTVSARQVIASFGRDKGYENFEGGITDKQVNQSLVYARLKQQTGDGLVARYCKAEKNLRALGEINRFRSSLDGSDINFTIVDDVEHDVNTRYQMVARKMVADYMKDRIARDGGLDRVLLTNEMGLMSGLTDRVTEKLKSEELRLRTEKGISESEPVTISDVGKYLFGTNTLTQLVYGDWDLKNSGDPRLKAAARVFNDALKEYAEELKNEKEWLRQTMGTDISADLHEMNPLKPYFDDPQEIHRLLRGARFESPDRDTGIMSNVRFYMMSQGMSMEETIAASDDVRKKAADDLMQMLRENPIPEGPDAGDQREKAVKYGKMFRDVHDRIGEYRLPEVDLEDPLSLVGSLKEIAAVNCACQDYLQNKRKLEKLPGYQEGFAYKGGLGSVEESDRAISVMATYTENLLTVIQMASKDDVNSLVTRAASKMFVDTYMPLFAGKSVEEACKGIGRDESLVLDGFTIQAKQLLGTEIRDADVRAQSCLSYLEGNSGAPIETGMAERQSKSVLLRGGREVPEDEKSLVETVREARARVRTSFDEQVAREAQDAPQNEANARRRERRLSGEQPKKVQEKDQPVKPGPVKTGPVGKP